MFVDGDEAFVMSALEEEYDDDFISDCGCSSTSKDGEDCVCGSGEIEKIAVKDEIELGATEADKDKELIKKVNEDIAKWRAEQAAKEEKGAENVVAAPIVQEKSAEVANLEDEERYYLEPLE